MKKSLLLLITLAGMPSYSFAGIGVEGTAFAQIPVDMDIPPPSMAIEVLRGIKYGTDPRGPLAVLRIGRKDAGEVICFDGGENPDITAVKSDNGAGDTLGFLLLEDAGNGRPVIRQSGYQPENCSNSDEYLIRKIDSDLGPPGIYTITVRARILH